MTITLAPSPADTVAARGSPANSGKCFETAHLSDDLRHRTIRGGAVTLLAQAAKFVLQTGSTAILARMLTPADFGLIAMVTVITGFVAMFKDAGLSTATVQREKITHEQISSLFWINVGLSVAIMCVIVALAPAIAWFYSDPRLTKVTLALAGTMIFGGLSVQHQALLRRQMQFGRLAIIEVASMIVGIGVAVVMGVYGFGYWSLVAMSIVGATVTALLSFALSGWVPGPPKRRTGVRPMLSFGGHLAGFNLLNYLTRNFDNVLVGTALGSQALGVYSKAYGLLMLPIRQINAPVSSVAISALSRLQNDPVRYRKTLCRMTELIAILGMPIVAFSFIDADVIIRTMLGPQWVDAVTPFRWLAPAAFAGTLNVVPGWVCTTIGLPHRQLYWAAVSAPITVAAFCIGVRWGVAGVAAAFTLSWTVLLIVFIVYSIRGTSVSSADLLDAIWRPVAASLAAAFLVGTAGLASHTSPLRCLAIDIPLFTAAFLAAFVVLPQGRTRLSNVMLVAKGLAPRSRK